MVNLHKNTALIDVILKCHSVTYEREDHVGSYIIGLECMT